MIVIVAKLVPLLQNYSKKNKTRKVRSLSAILLPSSHLLSLPVLPTLFFVH